ALLTLHQATQEPEYLASAKRLIDWVITATSCGGGFCGGFHGYDPKQVKLAWMSTEHNVDVLAAGRWLFLLTGEQKYANATQRDRLLAGLKGDRTQSGLLNASRTARLTTGLSIDPAGSTTVPDFFYYRRPHLGATAWAALAETGWNPFTGKRIQ